MTYSRNARTVDLFENISNQEYELISGYMDKIDDCIEKEQVQEIVDEAIEFVIIRGEFNLAEKIEKYLRV